MQEWEKKKEQYSILLIWMWCEKSSTKTENSTSELDDTV